MDDQKIYTALEEVKDAASFIAFLDILRSNWEDAKTKELENPSSPYSSMHGWQNLEIGSFLEAAVAGGTDIPSAHENTDGETTTAWRQAAQIILMGKIYE